MIDCSAVKYRLIAITAAFGLVLLGKLSNTPPECGLGCIGLLPGALIIMSLLEATDNWSIGALHGFIYTSSFVVDAVLIWTGLTLVRTFRNRG